MAFNGRMFIILSRVFHSVTKPAHNVKRSVRNSKNLTAIRISILLVDKRDNGYYSVLIRILFTRMRTSRVLHSFHKLSSSRRKQGTLSAVWSYFRFSWREKSLSAKFKLFLENENTIFDRSITNCQRPSFMENTI